MFMVIVINKLSYFRCH